MLLYNITCGIYDDEVLEFSKKTAKKTKGIVVTETINWNVIWTKKVRVWSDLLIHQRALLYCFVTVYRVDERQAFFKLKTFNIIFYALKSQTTMCKLLQDLVGSGCISWCGCICICSMFKQTNITLSDSLLSVINILAACSFALKVKKSLFRVFFSSVHEYESVWHLFWIPSSSRSNQPVYRNDCNHSSFTHKTKTTIFSFIWIVEYR